jgi:protocatechuate 3,4-dioxygenase beta subunit
LTSLSKARIIAGILLTLAAVRAFSQQQGARTIQGTIFVAGADQPVSSAQVTLTKTANPGSFPPAIAPILSDNRGAFAFRNLDAGSYRLTVMKNGYLREDASLTLTNSEPARNLAIRMTATAIVSGRIRDASGRPAADVPVQLLRRAYNQNGLWPQEAFRSWTNDLGEYRIYGIAPGRYYVAAGSTDSSASLRRFERYIFDEQLLNGENRVPVEYARVFLPGVSSMAKASALDIQPGSHHTDVDFTLTRQGLFSVRGSVTLSTTGLPPSHLNWSGHGGDYDAKTGRFELTGLLPDEYAFGLESESLRAFVTFTVGNSDIDGLVVVLEPPATILGKVEVEGVLPSEAQFQRMSVRLRRSEMSDYEVSSADVQADGTFSLDDVPVGRDYRITFSGPPSGFYLKAARLGGTDALDNFVRITRSADLDLVISSRTAQVRGVVTGANLEALAAAEVALIPDKRSREELIKSAMTGKDGRFAFSGVAPGDYKIFAWDGLDRLAFYDRAILAQFEELGTPIHVSESSDQSIELKAIPAGTVR